VGHRTCRKEKEMTILDILIGLVFIVISFAMMTTICFLGGAIFYYFRNRLSLTSNTGLKEETVFKKRKRKKRR